MNAFRKAFKWVGTPVMIEYKVTSNPYEGRKSNFTYRKGKSESQAENSYLKRKKKKPQQKRRSS
jgi:GTP-binding protein